MIYESRMLWLLMALTGFFAALALLQGSQMIYLYHHSSWKDVFSVWLQQLEKCIDTELLGICWKNTVSTNKCLNVTFFFGNPAISLSYMDIRPSKIRDYFNKQRMNVATEQANNNKQKRKKKKNPNPNSF